MFLEPIFWCGLSSSFFNEIMDAIQALKTIKQLIKMIIHLHLVFEESPKHASDQHPSSKSHIQLDDSSDHSPTTENQMLDKVVTSSAIHMSCLHTSRSGRCCVCLVFKQSPELIKLWTS